GGVDAMFAELHRLVPLIEARRGVRFELGKESHSTPSLMDAAVRDGLAHAARGAGVSHRLIASGGGHDAAAFAQAGVPAGMVFVRNQNGSHNPHEAMRMEDFAAGCAVLTRFVAEVGG
ncbi:MAG: M20/M25/M40 family metallo-hydrolase, partial [Acetobacteraceae bacterium]